MKHKLRREYAGKAEMGSITPTCSCGWRGRTEYRYNDHCHSNVKDQEAHHILEDHNQDTNHAEAQSSASGATLTDVLCAFRDIAYALQSLNNALSPHGHEGEINTLLVSAHAAIDRAVHNKI